MSIFRDIVESELNILSWMFMTRADIKKIVNVPYGVYAFTKPMKSLPKDDMWPHMMQETQYFGMAGKSESYIDFHHDRKRNSVNNAFWSQSILHMRISTHINKLSTNILTEEKMYNLYHELYGINNVDKIALCIMRPKKTIKDNEIRAWLKAMESNIILAYSNKFGQIPLLNSDHKVIVGNDLRKEKSYSNARRKQLENNLEGFFV